MLGDGKVKEKLTILRTIISTFNNQALNGSRKDPIGPYNTCDIEVCIPLLTSSAIKSFLSLPIKLF